MTAGKGLEFKLKQVIVLLNGKLGFIVKFFDLNGFGTGRKDSYTIFNIAVLWPVLDNTAGRLIYLHIRIQFSSSSLNDKINIAKIT